MSSNKPLTLIVLDGWGYHESGEGNAIHVAHTPNWDRIWQTCPHSLLQASGKAVGLPPGQMGNSEVGHLHIGAGQQVPQDIVRINQAIEDGSFYENTVLQQTIRDVVHQNTKLHLIGLVSEGGVHSHLKHFQAMIELAANQRCHNVCVHAITDGRDTPPKSAKHSLQALDGTLKEHHCGRIASLTGRYYAMDRDKRWDRTQKAYELMTEGKADYKADTITTALDNAYERGETDEFIKPTTIEADSQQQPTIDEGDAVIFINFRADRARQLSYALTNEHFDGFKRNKQPKLCHFVTMTEYDKDLDSEIAYPPIAIKGILGEQIASNHLKQLRLAETEKYAHVTFFFNGGSETPFDNEHRKMVPSPKVSTYDQAPAMSAEAVTDLFIQALEDKTYDVIVINYANADMVGHTGDFDSTVKAIEALDHQFGRINRALEHYGGEVMITADHGNAEKMYDEQTGQSHTAHTGSLVPLVYLGPRQIRLKKQGTLLDIAPTILQLLDLAVPAEMTGHSLLTESD